MFPGQIKSALRALIGAGVLFSATAIASAQRDASPISTREMPLRVALPQMDGDGSCQPATSVETPGAADYATHLQSRFLRPIYLCLGGGPEIAAKALVSGDLEMAWLDQTHYLDVADSTRAVMTLRPLDNIARVPVAVFTTKALAGAHSDGAPQNLGPIGMIDAPPQVLNRDRVSAVLQQWGVSMDRVEASRPYADIGALFQGLRSGEISMGATEIAAYHNACEIFDPSSDPCGDLLTLTTQRPAAEEGFVVAKDMPQEFRHRLVGVHVGLHMEAPAAFEWFAGGEAIEFSPAEATALDPSGAEYGL